MAVACRLTECDDGPSSVNRRRVAVRLTAPDKGLFQAAVMAIFGTLGENVDPDFIKDREALSGQPFNVTAMKAHVPFALTQIRAHAALLTQQLADGRAFLAGNEPCLADAAAYYNFWFVRTFCPGLADACPDLDRFDAWHDRVATIGHGERTSLTSAEALEIAAQALPEQGTVLASDADLEGRSVALAATDYGRDPIVGKLVGSTPYSLTILRETPVIGKVQVHVPRLGYSLAPA